MYLKNLEMVGFKSFADKTKLVFEPGMTAIVGPNGCGKSNVSDAIRWVLGEQSPKAMRGAAMTDVIFNGTDKRKPMGMAEVSITFADCEKTLNTEFHEVTIARRVFRSGEGQYFLNKTPCRLRDIQRLFMDTGVGTSSYSFMEQGRIDRILSARPEDRRAVFEEASGITKFKSDKKEALRKLEHTEANLLRLADVLREVKRQIGSLQRQAGKARRYKELSDELRRLDIMATSERVRKLEAEIREVKGEIAKTSQDLAGLTGAVSELEAGNVVLRESLMQTEREIASAMEAGMQARGKLDHTRELIEVNRRRIAEYQTWTERDTREVDVARLQLEERLQAQAELERQLATARLDHERASHELKDCNERHARHQQQIDAARLQIQRLREESVEAESRLSRLQNQLMELETRQRASAFQRERLAAEKAQLVRASASFDERRQEMDRQLAALREDAAGAEAGLAGLEREREARLAEVKVLQQERGELRLCAAAVQARIDLLCEGGDAESEFPAGCRLLMDAQNPLGIDRGRVLGALAAHVEAEPGYEAALEAALRSWFDAVIVADDGAAVEFLERIQARQEGSARLIPLGAADGAPAALPVVPGAVRLGDHVRCPEALAGALQRLIANVWVVDSLGAVPRPAPAGAAFVTRAGALWHASGCVEFWMREAQKQNPLSRRHAVGEARRQLAALESQTGDRQVHLEEKQGQANTLEEQVRAARTHLDACRRGVATKEGENQIISREAAQALERLETVSWELDNLKSADEDGAAQRKAIADQIAAVRDQRERLTAEVAAQSKALQKVEDRFQELQGELTDRRVRHSELTQRLAHLASQQEGIVHRLAELESTVAGRTEGLQSYEAHKLSLGAAIAAAEQQLGVLEALVQSGTEKADSLRRNGEKQAAELKHMEEGLVQKRRAQEELRAQRSQQDIRLTELSMRRQTQIERVTAEHKIIPDDVTAEPSEEVAAELATIDNLETRVAELRTKMDAMGPVNLVAIEEYKELEERFNFLSAQEQDLTNAKQQLMEMIRTINRTTTEMFSKTFEQVNTNFESMFLKLFNGGTARLVLVNEEDVLECGIEIIARPPGKRLQNVSLLSGGERTLTAVALLFAIYQIKPSPFCMLDELDAALDDANIGRFVATLRDFLSQSQFVAITHNRQTISAADILYGVTMPEQGVSKIVSMRFKNHEQPPAELAAAPAAPAATEAAAP